ncbi:hypothetical protein M8J76_008416 [Diaphorina citri]|nr:hypothetical protein M8J76_008416 [Diaphorina citri]
MNVSKSDEEFQRQHIKYKEKVLTDYKNPKNIDYDPNKTKNYLNNWYRYVEHKRELIQKMKIKTKSNKCTILERDIKNRKENRRVNLLITARQKQCIQEEFHGIPKYIKDNELFIKSCDRKRHEECKETYFKDQLELLNAKDLKEVNKYPSFDHLIIIGKKIQPQICLKIVDDELKEEIADEDVEEESKEWKEVEIQYENSVTENCEDSNTFLNLDQNTKLHNEHAFQEIQKFLCRSIAYNISMEIFNSILNGIFRNNIYYLKMKYSSHRFDEGSRIDENGTENLSPLSVESLIPSMDQKVDGNKSSQPISKSIKPDCNFVRSSDYMLNYIENKMKCKGTIELDPTNRFYEAGRIKSISENDEKSKVWNRINTYLYNMLVSIEENVGQLEKQIGVIVGYSEKKPPKTQESSAIDKSSIVSNRSKANMSKMSQINRNKEQAASAAMVANAKEKAMEKLLQIQIRNSPLFQKVLFLRIRYILLDAIDYVCEVSSK